MNDILKKRFRKIIRKHFEEKFTKSYERTKDMYQLLAFMDSVMDEVEIEPFMFDEDKLQKIKVFEMIIDDLYDFKKPIRKYPIINPVSGKVVNLVISWE